jgi:hypothetical protein
VKVRTLLEGEAFDASVSSGDFRLDGVGPVGRLGGLSIVEVIVSL